jgi:YegS/Rv2252/BmrU family lipid kinase
VKKLPGQAVLALWNDMAYFFIINPNSGRTKKKEIEKKIYDFFKFKNIEFEIRYTEARGHGAHLANEAIFKGFNNIIAVGGDGTIREVASVLLLKKELSLGIIPAGSGNGLARNLYMPLDIDESLEGILKWPKRKIDAGILNGDLFLCSAGLGLDAVIANLFNKGGHKRGILPYFLKAVKAFFNYHIQLTSVYEADKIERLFPFIIAAMNGKQYGGGALINPSGLIDDGFLELVYIDKLNIFEVLFNIKSLFDGSIDKKKFYHKRTFKNIEIRVKPNTLYHLDGEDFVSKDGVMKISILPNSLNVICPEV